MFESFGNLFLSSKLVAILFNLASYVNLMSIHSLSSPRSLGHWFLFPFVLLEQRDYLNPSFPVFLPTDSIFLVSIVLQEKASSFSITIKMENCYFTGM